VILCLAAGHTLEEVVADPNTQDYVLCTWCPRSSESPAREVPRSWESPRDIPKRAEGQNPTPVGEGVLPHLLNNFPPHLVFYSNSFTISIRTIAWLQNSLAWQLDSQVRLDSWKLGDE